MLEQQEQPGSSRRESDAGTSAPESTKAQPKSRRVPEHLRQRTEASCDRCRVRKIKCIRPQSDESCKACQRGKKECNFTLPRRSRVHVSSELDTKYRVLDALVTTLLPGRDISSLDSVIQLAKEHGANLDFVKDENHDESNDGRDIQDGWESSSMAFRPDVSTSNLGRSSSQPVERNNVSIQPPTRASMTSRNMPTLPDGTSIFTIPEGRLLPAPRGGYHYVGPASTIYFSITIRQIVSKADLISLMATDTDLFQRLSKAAEFTNYKVSQALEARIEGHPATNATEQTDDMPEQSPINVFPDPSNAFSLAPNYTSPRAFTSITTWRTILPPRTTADRLIQAFFEHVHPNYPIFHRGNFHVRYEMIWQQSQDTPMAADWHSGWASVVLMVFVLGALASERTRGVLSPQVIQRRYLGMVVREGLPRIAMTSSISNVQALMLLSLYEHNSGERNTAWNLIGQAARMAIALGLHRDGENAHFDPVERNSRRTIWWIVYMFEQNISFILGRPAVSDLIDLSAKLPDENFTDGNDYPPGFLEASVALTDLSIMVKRFVASISVFWDSPETLDPSCSTGEQIRTQLQTWRNNLPYHLTPDGYFATTRHKRAVILLHVYFQVVSSILGRPFILCKVNYEIESRTTSIPDCPIGIHRLASHGIEAGTNALMLLSILAQSNLLDGHVWLDLFYLHHTIYLLCTPYIARSPDESTESQTRRRLTSELICYVQRMSMAPTYRLLLKMTMQFAYAVGMGPEDEAEQVTTAISQGSGSQGLNSMGMGFSTSPQMSISNQLNPNPIIQPQLSTTAAFGTNQQGIPQPIQSQQQSLQQQPPSAQPLDQQQQQQQQQQQFTLDQIFGPMPSRPGSPRDPMADLWDFGLEHTQGNGAPWQFSPF